MKKIDFAAILAAMLAVLMNRSVLLMMNPFGIAYFVSAYIHGSHKLLLILGTLVGMATVMPLKIFLKYLGIIAGIVVIGQMLCVCRKKQVTWLMAMLSGILTGFAGVAYTFGVNGFYMENVWHAVLVNVLEGVVTGCLVGVFDQGVRMIYQKDGGTAAENTAQISLGCMIGVAVYAIWGLDLQRYSAVESVIFFLLLFVGYKYGAAASAIAGVFSGFVAGIELNDMSMVGLLCVIGAMAGVFKERGRLICAVTMMGTVGLIGWMGASYMLWVTTVRGLIMGVLSFLLVPEVLFKCVSDAGVVYGNIVSAPKSCFNEQTKKKLKAFSDSFKKLSDTFNEGVHPRAELSQEEVCDAFDELTQNVCAGCSRCSLCWDREYDDTSFATTNILNYCSKNGSIEKNQLPIAFRRRCINVDGFLSETARVVEVAKLNLNWRNKLMESRLAVAGQFFEVGDIIEDFTRSIDSFDQKLEIDTKRLKQRLKNKKIIVDDLSVIEKGGRRTCVYMTASMGRGRIVTSRDICEILSGVLHRHFVPGKECRMVISREQMTYEFVEDTKFKTMEGHVCIAKDQENVSGDAYTLFQLESGHAVMSLADGMGSGALACEESEYIIRLMEQLMETGFKRQAAVRLINSMMFLKSERQSFATVDMGMIDLFTGKCEFIKVGAAASFIKHEKNTETVVSSTLPIGAFTEVDYEGFTRQLVPGDMVFMVTDGVINSFQTDKGEDMLGAYIQSLSIKNPQEAAQAVLDYAVLAGGGAPEDDMSVLVTGLYENTGRQRIVAVE